ncbi:MAG: hypothetical protein JWM36_1029 [Hyphomicrobiales bacterium]|nr:hypothetical protein [Hyphomicrobiales bacterium]
MWSNQAGADELAPTGGESACFGPLLAEYTSAAYDANGRVVLTGRSGVRGLEFGKGKPQTPGKRWLDRRPNSNGRHD